MAEMTDEELIERIEFITTDWNGARMVDGEQPRIIPTCGELRAIADRLAAANAQLEFDRKVIARANNSLFGSWGYFLSLDGGEPNEHHLDMPIERLKETARHAEAAEARLAEVERENNAIRHDISRQIEITTAECNRAEAAEDRLAEAERLLSDAKAELRAAEARIAKLTEELKKIAEDSEANTLSAIRKSGVAAAALQTEGKAEELIERLREKRMVDRNNFGEEIYEYDPDCIEAADRLAAATAEQDELLRLTTVIAGMKEKARAVAAETRIKELEAEIERIKDDLYYDGIERDLLT